MSMFSGVRKWVYPLKVAGRFQRAHRLTGLVQLAILFGVPWISIGGNPLFRLDLPARRVYALGGVYTASDTVLLLLMSLFAAFLLFFFTSLFGRLWCGYFCPQTVFMEELIRPIEERIEGSRAQRMARDKGPWTFDKAWRKGAKWTALLAVAFAISMGFGQYFAGAPEIWLGQAGSVDYALVGVFTAVWFADFAWFREQLCNYLCPYARFQGALTDDESLVISYNVARGEPRGGKLAKKEGHCIDCDKCVAVCPQGIDIRDGYQLECVNCARCVDACEGVMGKLGHESLVTYTTYATEQGRPPRLIRPRTVGYATLLTGIVGVFVFLVATHKPFEAMVARAPGTLFTEDADGFVRNTYLLTVKRNDTEATPVKYAVEVVGLDGAQLTVDQIELGPQEVRRLPLIVRVPKAAAGARTENFKVKVQAGDDALMLKATFKSGAATSASAPTQEG